MRCSEDILIKITSSRLGELKYGPTEASTRVSGSMGQLTEKADFGTLTGTPTKATG